MSPGRMIVAWHHGHPDLGAFFSGGDRRTQHRLFHRPYSLGMVVDPWRREGERFVGGEAVPPNADHGRVG
jgi:proteasome lid subunit RPN8/RPN11